MIQLQLASPKIWHIRQPEVLRVMPEKFVDAFFVDGSLRLSSMMRFRKHPDEQQGDTREGERHARHTSSNGSQFIFFNMNPAGSNAYILSATANPDGKTLSAFGDAAIRIKTTYLFAAAIAAVLPNFVEGIEGPCFYSNDLVLDRNAGPDGESFFPKKGEGFRIGGPNQARAMAQMQAGPEFYFKKRRRYSRQREYRFVWLTSSAAQDYLDIKAPEARAFCEKVDLTGTKLAPIRPLADRSQ